MRGPRGWLAPAPPNKTAISRAQQTMGQAQLFVGPAGPLPRSHKAAWRDRELAKVLACRCRCPFGGDRTRRHDVSFTLEKSPVMLNQMTPVDPRALKVLFSTYWTSGGWRNRPTVPPRDLAYAKSAGLMFDHVRMTHSDVVTRAIAAVQGVERRAVADAFLVSLSSRRLELRSALGSFAVLQHFAAHDAPRPRAACAVCGVHNRDLLADLSQLNFERFKWGGTRHDEPLYASRDLQLFQELPAVVPDTADVGIFKGLLKAIEAVPPETSSAFLQKHLATAFESNKREREAMLEILGICGILAPADHPGYVHRFVPYSERKPPAWYSDELAYPACWWNGIDGINQEAVSYWFGHVL
jgi:hypothetical protein